MLLKKQVKSHFKGFEASFMPVLLECKDAGASVFKLQSLCRASKQGAYKVVTVLYSTCFRNSLPRLQKGCRLQDYLDSVPIGACLPDFTKE